MKFKDEENTSKSIEVLDTMFIHSVQSKILELLLERVLSLSITENNKEIDEKESEVLAMFKAQPPWNISKPQQWEELTPP